MLYGIHADDTAVGPTPPVLSTHHFRHYRWNICNFCGASQSLARLLVDEVRVATVYGIYRRRLDRRRLYRYRHGALLGTSGCRL